MRILIKKYGLKPKDQFILLDESFVFLEDDWYDTDALTDLNDVIMSNYYNQKFFAKFLTESRIDLNPIFIIDTTQVDRDKKIFDILN